jgi:hypothetical protein
LEKDTRLVNNKQLLNSNSSKKRSRQVVSLKRAALPTIIQSHLNQFKINCQMKVQLINPDKLAYPSSKNLSKVLKNVLLINPKIMAHFSNTVYLELKIKTQSKTILFRKKMHLLKILINKAYKISNHTLSGS